MKTTTTTSTAGTISSGMRRVALVGAAGVLAAAGMAVAGGPAQAASDSVWDRVAECESGGDWDINTGNGYYGGLQFSLSTWEAFGGEGMPHEASKSEQIRVAQNTLEEQGPGAWPVCSKEAGLTKENGAADDGGGSDEGTKDEKLELGSTDGERPQLGG